MPPALPVDLYLDNLDLSRLERMRLELDFPNVPSPDDEYSVDWPYSDEDTE